MKRLMAAVVAATLGLAASHAMAQGDASCNQLYDVAVSTGLLAGYSLSGGVPQIVVGARIFGQLPFAAKVNFAEMINCVGAGPGMQFEEIEFRSDVTNRVLARWYWGELTVE